MNKLIELGARVLAAQAFAQHVGTELLELVEGKAVLRVPLRAQLKQQHGFAHGGVIAYLADNALTFAGGSVLGPAVVTAGYSLTFMRPGLGDALVARAHVLERTKQQALCRCEVFAIAGGQERLCAAAQGTIARLTQEGDGGD